MIVLLLGLIDLFAAAMIPLLNFFPSLQFIGLMSAGLLFLKSVFFLDDFTSWIDLVAVLFLVLASLGITNMLSYILMVWLLQKGLRSLF